MIKGIDVNQRIEFVSKSDHEQEKTVFVFRPMTSIEMMDLASDAIDGSVQIKGAKIFDYLERCIVEIRNYQEGLTVRQAIETLPMTVLTELIKEMENINKISEQERKNS